MEVKWTTQQQQVIDLRGCNLLVSAAAGSGKTAVLVERILTRVMDEKNPLSLDHLLVVTFTKAAAAEMKERIRLGLEEKIEQNPDNKYLVKQQMALHHARISTIDSFCSYLIQNYFHVADLDPACRIAEERELAMLKADVAKEVLEAHFAEGTESFFEFVEFFAFGKEDERLDALLIRMHDFAETNPDPEEWLRGCMQAYRSEQLCSPATFLETPLGCLMCGLANQEMRSILQQIEEAKRLCVLPDGPAFFLDMLCGEETFWTQCEAADWEKKQNLILSHKIPQMRAPKGAVADSELTGRVRAIMAEVRSAKKKLTERFFAADLETELLQASLCTGPGEMLAELAIEFSRSYRAKKAEKHIMDFSDLEHAALKILWEDNKPSETAVALQSYYQEILIDEYQDSNLLQEKILSAISRQTAQSGNLFMVGDVKQSIYKFRQARPDLFMNKLGTYRLCKEQTETSDKNRKVLLHKNFRSRREVLDSVNAVFRSCMCEEVGGIAYGEDEALHCGAVYPESGAAQDYRTEVWYVSKEQEESGLSAAQAETEILVSRIRRLTDPEEGLLVGAAGEQHIATYKDIVILLRSRGERADTFVNALMDAGIMAYAESTAGFFQTREVETVVNYLYLLDNPLQDIPLAAVLRSPFVGLSSDELAQIRIAFPDIPFYEAAKQYMQSGTQEKLCSALKAFYTQLDEYREALADTRIHELLWRIFRETGIYDFFASMPGGALRAANLDLLLEQAKNYETTSYQGLFHFVRYLEQLKEYEIELGEASLAHESMDAVRIMTIHKSKGLEFPIVFLSGLDRKMNDRDEQDAVLLHPEYGIGLDAVDCTNRTRHVTLQKRILKRQMRIESRAEELRVLYVGMTRAKEKLILTAAAAESEIPGYVDRRLSFGELVDSSSYWKWLCFLVGGGDSPFVCTRFCIENPEHSEKWISYEPKPERNEEEQQQIEQLKRQLEGGIPQKEPFYARKVSVSELKKNHYGLAGASEAEQAFEQAQTKELYAGEDSQKPLPRFLQETEASRELYAANRGVAYHKVMECYPYALKPSNEQIQELLKRLVEQGQLTVQEAKSISIPQIAHLVSSALGQRMKRAALEGTLHREQPFMLKTAAAEVYPELSKDAEPVVVQGIIDAYFEEQGEWVLVDYKTDRVSREDGREKLIRLYHVQLQYYARALEQLTGKPVKEKVLYSFALGESIIL